MDISGADGALVPQTDAVNDSAVDVIVNLCQHCSSGDDVNADAFDDWLEFAFSPKFLASDAACIYNRDALSYEGL